MHLLMIVTVLAVIFVSSTEHSAAYTDQFERQVWKGEGKSYIVGCCCCEHLTSRQTEPWK